MNIARVKLHVFIPVFLLFFSYTFGVASNALGDKPLLFRVAILLVCASLLLLVKVKINLVKLAGLLCLLIFFISYFINSNAVLLLNFIYLSVILYYFYVTDVDKDDLLASAFYASYAVILLYILYSLTVGIDLSPVVIGDRTRYYFGFVNPNKVGIVAFSLIILTITFLIKRNPFLGFALCMPFLAAIILSGSRTALYSLCVFLLISCVSQYHFRFILKKFIVVTPLLFLACSLLLNYYHNDNYLNNILSNRPLDIHNFLSTLNSNNYVFGANSDGFRVDNSYLLSYFSVGPLGWIFFIFFLAKAVRQDLSRVDVAFIYSMFAYGFMEGVLVRVEFPIILYFYYLIFGRISKKPKIEA